MKVDSEFKKWWFSLKKEDRPKNLKSAEAGWNAANAKKEEK